jgi:hypothetical protein
VTWEIVAIYLFYFIFCFHHQFNLVQRSVLASCSSSPLQIAVVGIKLLPFITIENCCIDFGVNRFLFSWNFRWKILYRNASVWSAKDNY